MAAGARVVDTMQRTPGDCQSTLELASLGSRMSTVRALAGALSLAVLASVAGAQTASSVETLGDVLRALHAPVESTSLPNLDRRVTSFVIDTAPGLFAIAFYGASPDSLYVATLDRTTGRAAYAALDRQSSGVPAGSVGALMGVHHSRRNILIDTHVNPSAGTIVVLSRSLARVTSLPGWVLRVLPTDVVLYHRSSVHFAPTHSAELWTWDPATHRDARLYPNAPYDSVRRAYVDTVRAIYERVGPSWFRANDHHMDPERFDSRLGDAVVVAPSGRTLAFTMMFGGGEGTPAETPHPEVAVVCRGVGSVRARCVERPLSDLLAHHPGWSVTDLQANLVGVRVGGQSKGSESGL
jgi:hypothetical protein